MKRKAETIEPDAKKLKPIHATATYNYMNGDPLSDYLKLYSTHRYNSSMEPNNFYSFIMERGHEFEAKIIDYLSSKITIVDNSEVYSEEAVEQTFKLMKQGVSAIHSAPIKSEEHQLYGIADLLVRSDQLWRLVNNNPLDRKEQHIGAPKLSHSYHYVIVDIKYSMLPLRSDGIHILNSGHYKAYKAQLYVYSLCLAELQGYQPSNAYILGRGGGYTSCNVNYVMNKCDDKLGIIDYKSLDKDYSNQTQKAIDWYRDLLENGQNWVLTPEPSREELYPNMKYDNEFQKRKKEIANELSEITSIWYCGLRERQRAFEQGVKSWRDPRCTAELLGFKGHRAKNINNILNINRQTEKLILPEKLQFSNELDANDRVELFIDQEFLGGFLFDNDLPITTNDNFTFLIGVGYYNNGWQYKKFIAQKLVPQEERRILIELVDFVESFKKPIKMYHWFNCEAKLWDLAKKTWQKSRDSELKADVQLCDLCEYFQSEAIAIKDCFNYKLKSVAKAFHKHKFIEGQWDSECQDGLTAMVEGWRRYTSLEFNIETDKIIKDIIRYNEVDCKVLSDILEFLRQKFL